MEAASLAAEDRELLSTFFHRLQRLLGLLVEDRHGHFSPEVRRLLEGAWTELESEGRFEEVQAALASDDQTLADGLAEHGLRGAQLRLKMATAERSFQALDEVERKRIPRWRKWLRVAPWALKTANVALGSIANVIPPVGAIKEVKDAAEAALDERVPLGKAVARGSRGVARGFRRLIGRRGVEQPDEIVSA